MTNPTDPHPAVDLHPMKQETFSPAVGINIDNNGVRRPVEKFHIESSPLDSSLYMGRQADHRDFHYLESWLIPSENIRVNRFHFRDGIKPSQDLYVDIALCSQDGDDEACHGDWHTTDLYIDVVTHHDGRVEVLDLDEFGAALDAGFISPDIATQALIATQRLLDGIKLHGDTESWLKNLGYQLTWK